jgi:hypothetical protein
MPEQSNPNQWSWNELNPVERVVIAAFSRHVERPGALPGPDYLATLAEVFPNHPAHTSGAFSDELHSHIIDQISGYDHASVSQLTSTLGRLAGGTEHRTELAALAARQLTGNTGHPYDAKPVLGVLSELAIEHIRPTTD